MKKKSSSLLIMTFAGFFAASLAWADCPMQRADGGKMDCDKASSCPMQKGCDEEYACPITEKFMKKAQFFLNNKSEIGLSDEQVRTIKGLKNEVKKAYMRQVTEMQIFFMDVKEKMSEPTLDVDALNNMVDQASAGMASGSKGVIASYAKLKAVLTPEQMTKAKEIWEKTA